MNDKDRIVPIPSEGIMPERDIGKPPVLEARHLGIDFGGLTAVDDFNLIVGRTEIAGLIGPNGAGKTTVFNLLTKVYQPTRGTILLNGKDTSRMNTVQVNKAGIARTFQNIRLFNELTVEENVKVGLHNHTGYGMWSGIFRLPRYWKEEKKASETALSNYKKHSDAWIKYQAQVNDMGVDEQIESYKRQLYNYNAMVSEMVTSTAYSAEEIKEIWEDFYEYKADVDLKIGKLENEKNYAVYEKWKSDAKNWKNIRDTYDDWDETGDSHIQFYERSIERIQEMYDGGFVGSQEYSDDTMYAVLNLYNAKIEATDALLDKQKEYINNLKEQFSSEEKALGTKWEVEDRNESKSEISHKLSIYKNAVTQKGMDTYKSLQEQMKKIKREEEMYKLQKTHTATLTSLENSYDTVEANKKYLLATIEKNGMNIEKIVKSVNFDVKNMQSVITSLFNQTISAIKSIKVSSNSYSDNRNISIRGDSRDILNALQNRVGLAVSYGNYN